MKIFNTLTRQKEEFVPLEEGKVKMYVCGPTVYNLIHIGNARPMIIFDTVRRYLEYKGYEVNYVSNFTDVDDKIIKKAIEEGVSAEEISQRYIAECKKDMAGMNVKPATTHPLATQEIDGMIDMIQTLIDKGYAYPVADGTVYFRVKKFKEYGKLSHKNLDDLQSGFRSLQVSGEDQKEDPLDFVLWKPKKEGEPFWKSPWCDGRPGWHIECSVMSKKYLGEEIDIHAGGEDLVFPHHENEIAQSEIQRSFYTYTITVDLDRVGIDGEVQITGEEKANRVKTLLDTVQYLYRDIKGRRENLSPLFVIGGRYERRNPFFENRIRIENDQINVETLAELLEDDAIRTHTFTGVVTGTFDNENEIRGKLSGESVGAAFRHLKEEVEQYYGESN